MWKGLEELLPLRGRWLRYFVRGVLLLLAFAALFVPILEDDGGYMPTRMSLWDVLRGR